MRKMLSLEDKYMFASIDQKYWYYAQKAVEFAKGVFEGKTFSSKITHIAPTKYSGTSG
jgi:hypothetical protein